MKLIKIYFEGVRNLEDTELDFDPQVNYILGDNGAGKTSLLEAIHFLAVGRSFRTNRDLDIVKFNAPYLKISGMAVDNHDKIEAEIRFFENTKITYLQHHKQDKLSSYLGWLPIVTILLSDIDLVHGPPTQRRNFIDLAISKINKVYLKHLIEYRRVLMQRNKLLREKADSVHYEVWEEILAKSGSIIIQERMKYVPLLLEEAQRICALFLKDKKMKFEYKMTLTQSNKNINNIYQQFLDLLRKNRDQDKEIGHTQIGPHRDDILIYFEPMQVSVDYEQVARKNSRELFSTRQFGSEGEMRLAALALKMAEAQKLREKKKEPVFLLDEVASELDQANTKKLFDFIQGQFFYATAKSIENILMPKGKIFYVQEGKIKEIRTIS